MKKKTLFLDLVEASVLAMDPNLAGSEVEVVGMTESQRGRSCGDYDCCGTALVHIGSHVSFRKTQFA